MERKDLLEANAAIFSVQGKALNDHASRDVKVLVVGNPANTNALIAQQNAPDLDPKQFTAMTRLDHNRAAAQLANQTGKHVTDVKKVTIWGNHSATQYPDISNTTVGWPSRSGPGLTTPGTKRPSSLKFSSAVPPSSRRAVCLLPPLLPTQRLNTCAIGRWALGRRLGLHGDPV